MTPFSETPVFRAIDLDMRGIDEDTRTASFVAATEIGVSTRWGPEHLRMSGAKLSRFQKNPVILDAHSRGRAGDIVGRAVEIKTEGKQLLVKVQYARTRKADEVWDLVRTGFLRSVSVGFIPTKVRDLEDGDVDGDVRGPATVIHEWELFEISMVPVPADQDALIRRSWREAMGMDFTKLYPKGEDKKPEAARAAFGSTAIPADKAAEWDEVVKQRAAEEAALAEKHKSLGLPAALAVTETRAAAPAPVAEGGIVKASLVYDIAGKEVVHEQKPAKRDLVALREDVMAITPTALRTFSEGLLVEENMTVEIARKRLQAEWARINAPVGTPEPPKPEAPKQRDISNEDFLNALK